MKKAASWKTIYDGWNAEFFNLTAYCFKNMHELQAVSTKKDTGKDKQGVQQTTSVCSIEDVLFERTFNASQFLVNHYHWLNCLGGVCLM